MTDNPDPLLVGKAHTKYGQQVTVTQRMGVGTVSQTPTVMPVLFILVGTKVVGHTHERSSEVCFIELYAEPMRQAILDAIGICVGKKITRAVDPPTINTKSSGHEFDNLPEDDF